MQMQSSHFVDDEQCRRDILVRSLCHGAVSRADFDFAPLPPSHRLGGPPHFGRRTFALISSISFTIFFSTFLRRALISTVCWGKGRGTTRGGGRPWEDVSLRIILKRKGAKRGWRVSIEAPSAEGLG